MRCQTWTMRIPESSITAAAFLFESLRGATLRSHELGEIRKAGLDDVDPELLARELKSLIASEHKGDSRDRQQAYWALGKKLDHVLIPFYQAQLRLELRRDMFAVYQIMIALQDLDESIFDPHRSGYSCHDYELNRLDAERYLNAVDHGEENA